MEASNLKDKWNALKHDNIYGFRSLRISSDSIPDLYIGLDENGNHCLILRLPPNFMPSLTPMIKENLALEFFLEKRLLILKLLFPDYTELFDDLIISLYNSIKSITEPVNYTAKFIASFVRWSEFFNEKVSKRLSEECIKGLFGEILVLNQLLQEAQPPDINTVLKTWRGPFGDVHDFMGNGTHLEVKSKEQTSAHIVISNEFQLESKQETLLQLVVADIFQSAKGLSLGDLLTETRRIISEKYGSTSLLLIAISQIGLTFNNIHEYNSFRYIPAGLTFYNCDAAGFPKITRIGLPEAVGQVKYSLSVDLLYTFIVSRKTYKWK